MAKFLTIGLLMLICAGIIIGWNVSRFIGAKPKPRTKDLDFLPHPMVAKMLSMGHASTAAKLRWIDSFAYFEYQLDRKDDSVTGDAGSSGFFRLYDMLITLDPYFQPFYEHAALNLGGILGRHWQSLGFLERGLLALPHSTELWRNAAAELKVHFNWEEKQPASFDQFLAAWVDAEQTDDGKRMVYDWKKSMGGRKFKDLEQLPYWLDRLQSTAPKTPLGDYVENVIRSQLANYGQRELTALLELYRRQHRQPARLSERVQDLGNESLSLADCWTLGGAPERLDALLRPEFLKIRYPERLPAFGPIIMKDGQVALRADPYGFSWRIEGTKVISPGLNHGIYESKLFKVNALIEEKAKDHGAWPRTLEELTAWGVSLPPNPMDGTLRLEDKWVRVEWNKETGEPWKLR